MTDFEMKGLPDQAQNFKKESNKSLYADKITFMTVPQRHKNFTI